MFSPGNHPKKWLILSWRNSTNLPRMYPTSWIFWVKTMGFLFQFSTIENWGCVSLIFEGVRCSSSWAVKVRVLNSRWRLLSYGSQSGWSCFRPEASWTSWKTRGLSTWNSWNMRISPTFWACFPKWMSKQQHVGFYTGMAQVKLQNEGVGAGFQASCIHWKPWSNISLLSLPVGRFLFFFVTFTTWMVISRGILPSRILILGRPWSIYQ